MRSILDQCLQVVSGKTSVSSIIPISPDGMVQSSPTRLIYNGGEPARVFVPGWQPRFVYTGLKPISLVLFEHEEHGPAIWYLDEAMSRLGGSFAELTPASVDKLSVAAATHFGMIWKQIVVEQRPPVLPDAVLSFFTLPLSIRHQVLDAYLSQTDISTLYHSIDNPSGLSTRGKLVNVSGRRVLLDPLVMRRLFDPNFLQASYVRLLQTGVLIWPSPVDGQDIRATHCFIIGPNRFAYRLPDIQNGLTFYVIADEVWFRTACIYVPEAQLALALDPDHARALMPDLGRTMFQHVVEHGDNLYGYLQRPAARVQNVWRGATAIHLGHMLWQDISGVCQLVESVPADKLPTFRLFDCDLGPEMYGPLDEIFPELKGRVTRDPGPFVGAIPGLYRDGVLAIKSSGMFISRTVRERIIDAIWRNPLHAQQIAECEATVAAGRPVIVLGLRTENRTLVNLIGFYERLADFLVKTVEKAVLVLDGHSARQGNTDKMMWSHGEKEDNHAPIEMELAILTAIQRRVQRSEVLVVSTISRPLSNSLIWGSFCHAFVAPWGAGLAKYRWVCNKPGFILTNHWNLHHRTDLHIYDAPEFTESPAPVEFINPDHVTDHPNASLLVPLGTEHDPSVMNFSVDEPATFRAIFAMVQRHA